MSSYDYEIGEQFTATGTAQASVGDLTQVNGSGTAFTTEFAIGYLVTINNETRIVSSITHDTFMNVSVAFGSSVASAAFTGVNLINVEDLTTPVLPPKGTFQLFSQYTRLGSALVRGSGWSTAKWAWGFLSNDQRDQLRTFCALVASNDVYIRTRNNENTDEFAYYSATLVWPQGEEKLIAKRFDFSLAFINAVEVTVS